MFNDDHIYHLSLILKVFIFPTLYIFHIIFTISSYYFPKRKYYIYSKISVFRQVITCDENLLKLLSF